MSEADILFERRGRLGVVTLNRPRALNALTLPMIRAYDPQLQAWAADSAIDAVVLTGAGGKAFCAGGDVVSLVRDRQETAEGRSDGAIRRDFFREEYALNRRIKRFPKPYVSLMDGITMGGGVGLSVHGAHRIGTERTVMAMPETAIGLFPDVGGTYFLPRCPGETGTYLALSSERIGAADCLYAGAVDAVVASDSVPALLDALSRGVDSDAAVRAVMAAHAIDPGPAPLAARREAIDRCFGHDRAEDILAALAAEGTEWASGLLEVLRRVSPTAVKVTLAALRRAATRSFEEAMVTEYRLVQAFMAGNDFYEGVRAALIDKDRNPRWSPDRLEAVDEAMVERHFAVPADGDLRFA